ncbi:MAG: SDR family oxidoreductase [Bacteroidota bacterium]|nr:SDR family oxidoreductase [Bacteroidota bacterium]MEC8967521.1 SDR family oxidoreductase [Bacteroidota bacterium]
MKKILVTGSNGLLGQKLVHLILDHSNHILLATSKGENRLNSRSDFDYRSLDITDRNGVDSIVSEFEPDVLINSAAMTNVDACESNKENCIALNVEGVKNLVAACENHNTHLIHVSTDFVFDGKAGPYSENDQPNPLSFYGQSKYDSELIVSNSSLSKWSIARTIIIYGIVENMSKSNIVLWAKSALESGSELKIVDDQFRSPTYADDLAKGCLLIAEKEKNGIYHLSGKESMSILELVYRVADFYGLDKSTISPVKSESLNQAAKRPPVTGFVLDKANKELGYFPLSFNEGLKLLSKEIEELT